MEEQRNKTNRQLKAIRTRKASNTQKSIFPNQKKIPTKSHTEELGFFFSLSHAYHRVAPIYSYEIPGGSKNPSGDAGVPGHAHQGLTPFGVH